MGTISRETFLSIWKWKGAMRVIRHTSVYVEGQVTKARWQKTNTTPAMRWPFVVLPPSRWSEN